MNWNMPQKQKSGCKWLQLKVTSFITSGRYEIYNTGHPQEDYFNMYRIDDKSDLKEAVLYVDYKTNIREHNMAGLQDVRPDAVSPKVL